MIQFKDWRPGWRTWLLALVVATEALLIWWSGGVDPKAWAPSIGANLATMLIAAVIVDHVVRREAQKKAERFLQLTLLQVGTAISYAMGVIRAPEVYPINVIDGMMGAWPIYAGELARQLPLVSNDLDVERRTAINGLEAQMRVTAPFLTGKLLTEGNMSTVGFVLQTWVAYRRIWLALYPSAKVTVIPSGDQLVKEVEAKLNIKLEEMPPMTIE